MCAGKIPFPYTFIEALVGKFFLRNRAIYVLLLFLCHDCKRARSTSDNRNENLTLSRTFFLLLENYEDNRNENSTLLAMKTDYEMLRV